MKKTALDFFAENVGAIYFKFGDKIIDLDEFSIEYQKLIEESKEMHKKELIKTWDTAIFQSIINEYGLISNVIKKYKNFDEYYQETFKKEKL
jgi:hypothetical protein